MVGFDKDAFKNILKTLSSYYGSINKFASKADLSPSYISKAIRSMYKTPPHPKTLRSIADSSDGLFTYIELMYICGYFTDKEYNILKKQEEIE